MVSGLILRGTDGDKAAYNIANIARGLNNNNLLTYSTKLMSATDDSFRVIMARARAREQAVRFALDQQDQGIVMSKAARAEAEDRFYKGLLDENGDVDLNSDMFLKSMSDEVTLTQELTGFAAGLDAAFEKAPILKPFYLFARTGVNGLALGMKNTPLLNLALTKQRKILTGSAKNLDELRQFGINSMEDLANEKSLMLGRQTIGMAVTFMAVQKYLNGDLRGNGPVDRQQRGTWEQGGWRPREVRLGDIWVGYDMLEPWSQWLGLIADVGDASRLMGKEWTEQQYKTLGLIASESFTSKSYLQSVQQLTDLLTNEPYKYQRIAGGLMNNVIPLAGLRNEIGKIISPYTRELSGSIIDAIRNRNLATEGLAEDPMPLKYNLLKDEPLRDWDVINRFYNALSPIPLNLDDSPGQKLLFASNYDTRTTVNSYKGISFADYPKIRSLFGREISKQNLYVKLNILAQRKDVQESLKQMEKDMKDPDARRNDPGKAYLHNRLIDKLFRDAKKQAWANIQSNPEVQMLIEQDRKDKARAAQSLFKTKPSRFSISTG